VHEHAFGQRPLFGKVGRSRPGRGGEDPPEGASAHRNAGSASARRVAIRRVLASASFLAQRGAGPLVTAASGRSVAEAAWPIAALGVLVRSSRVPGSGAARAGTALTTWTRCPLLCAGTRPRTAAAGPAASVSARGWPHGDCLQGRRARADCRRTLEQLAALPAIRFVRRPRCRSCGRCPGW
jgi:hypothetical protein